MWEFFKGFGVKMENFLISLTVGVFLIFYKILETDPPPTTRQKIQLAIGGLVSIVLVPGFAVETLKIESPFYTGALTGLVVYTFPKLMPILGRMFINKVEKNDND